jgi:hypothetical protein
MKVDGESDKVAHSTDEPTMLLCHSYVPPQTQMYPVTGNSDDFPAFRWRKEQERHVKYPLFLSDFN